MMLLRLIGAYTCIALIVLAPLLLPGFVLTLDMVFVPHPPLVDVTRSSYPFHAALHGLSYIIPAEALQKLLLLTIAVGSGVSAHLLVRYIYANQTMWWHWAYLAAGILYMINPFTYSRFMAGQYSVLLGYAIVPVFVVSMLRFAAAPSARAAAVVAAWAAIISIVSIHTTGLLLVVALVTVAAALVHYRADKLHQKKILFWAAGSAVMWIAVNSYWLLPLAFGASSTADVVNQFGQTDRQAFATLGAGAFEVFLNMLRLQGFWAEARGLYILPQQMVPLWGLLWLLLLGVVAAGFVYMWRQRRFAFWVVVPSGFLAVLLASGYFGELLARVIPFFAGYREPHKFLGLLVLAYAVALPAGMALIIKKRSASVRIGISAACIGLTLLVSLPMLWGFTGQLRPTQYPHGWYQVNDALKNEPHGKVVFLPWHAYMTFSFSGRIIENPAPHFFDRHVMSSNDPEYRGVQPTYPDPLINQVAAVLRQKDHATIIPELRNLGVSHILLAKEFDFADYAYITALPGVELAHESEYLNLYRIIPKQEAR